MTNYLYKRRRGNDDFFMMSHSDIVKMRGGGTLTEEMEDLNASIGIEISPFTSNDFKGIGLQSGTTFVSSNVRVAVKIPADFKQIKINSITGTYSWVLNCMNMPNPNLDMGDMIGQVGTRVFQGTWSQSAPFVIERPNVDFNFAFLMIAKGTPTSGVADPDISTGEAYNNVKFSVVVNSVKVLKEVVENLDGHETRISEIEQEVEELSQGEVIVDYTKNNLANVGVNQSQTGYTTALNRVSVKLPYNLSYVEILSCASGYRYALQSWTATNADAELLTMSGTRIGNSGWLNHSTDVLNKVDSANYSVLTFSKSSGNISTAEAFDNVKFRAHTGEKNMFGNVGYEDVEVIPNAIDFNAHRCWKSWEQQCTNFGLAGDGLQSCAMYGNYLFQYQSNAHKFRVFTLDGVFVSEFECTVIGHGNSIQFGTVEQEGGFPYLYCSGKTDADDSSLYKTIQVLRVTTNSFEVVKTITLDANVKTFSDVAFDFKKNTLYVYSTDARSGGDSNVWLTKYTATNLESSSASTLTFVSKRELNVTLGTQQSVCFFNGMFCVLSSEWDETHSTIHFFKCSDLSEIGTYTWPKISNAEYQSLMPYKYNGRWIIYTTSWFRYTNNNNDPFYYRLSYIQ